jgi:hypothetical protein
VHRAVIVSNRTLDIASNRVEIASGSPLAGRMQQFRRQQISMSLRNLHWRLLFQAQRTRHGARHIGIRQCFPPRRVDARSLATERLGRDHYKRKAAARLLTVVSCMMLRRERP